MKLPTQIYKKPRIEMLPLIDIVFLVLVFFIYAMLSMAVHRGVPVVLPTSSTAGIDPSEILSLTVISDGSFFLDKERILPEDLTDRLKALKSGNPDIGILLFADSTLPYQQLFHVLDRIRMAGIQKISLQAEAENTP